MNWEYLIGGFHSPKELNDIGADGWELVSVETRRIPHHGDPGEDLYWLGIFKRPKIRTEPHAQELSAR